MTDSAISPSDASGISTAYLRQFGKEPEVLGPCGWGTGRRCFTAATNLEIMDTLLTPSAPSPAQRFDRRVGFCLPAPHATSVAGQGRSRRLIPNVPLTNANCYLCAGNLRAGQWRTQSRLPDDLCIHEQLFLRRSNLRNQKARRVGRIVQRARARRHLPGAVLFSGTGQSDSGRPYAGGYPVRD